MTTLGQNERAQQKKGDSEPKKRCEFNVTEEFPGTNYRETEEAAYS